MVEDIILIMWGISFVVNSRKEDFKKWSEEVLFF
jgi:hypothetical protein